MRILILGSMLRSCIFRNSHHGSSLDASKVGALKTLTLNPKCTFWGMYISNIGALIVRMGFWGPLYFKL